MSSKTKINLLNQHYVPFSIDKPPSPSRSKSPSFRNRHLHHPQLSPLTLRQPPDMKESPIRKLLTPEVVSGTSHLSSPWKGIKHVRNKSREKPIHKTSLQRGVSTSGVENDSRFQSLLFSQMDGQQSEASRKTTLEQPNREEPREPTLIKMDETYSYSAANDIDYTKPHASRPLEIRVDSRSIYISPDWAPDVSPLFTNFLARELAAGKRQCVQMQRDDISFDEVYSVIEVIGPTELGIFPKPVDSTNFLSLARISRKFQIPAVSKACELFVAKLALDDPDVSTEDMCLYLLASYKYRLNRQTRIRLLEGFLGRGCMNVHPRTAEIPGLPQMIKAAFQAYDKNEFNHRDLSNDVKLRMPCRTCRLTQPNVPLAAVKGELSTTGLPAFVVCTVCKSTICCACVLKPCKKALDDFVTKFSEAFKAS